LECRALVLNINYGKNQELLNRCKPLLDYSRFIYYIREGTRKELTAQEAMDQAIERCLNEDILTDVLTAHRKEVVSMFLEEYDEELHYRTLRREGYEDGFEDGRDDGLNEGQIKGEARMRLLHQKLLEDKRIEDLYRSFQDKSFEEELYAEYGL
jgi:flagellar biosynthesis/type III secretory pathway protein FliH